MNPIIKPTEEQIEYTRQVIQTWGSSRGFFDGNQIQKEQGILGQIIICDLLGKSRTTDLSQQDNGVDFMIDNKAYDVKSRKIKGTRDRPEYNNVVPDTQMRYETHAFVFMVYNMDMKDFEMPGWITKEEFKEKATLRKKGETDINGLIFPEDTWTIQSKHLRTFTELLHLNSNGENA